MPRLPLTLVLIPIVMALTHCGSDSDEVAAPAPCPILAGASAGGAQADACKTIASDTAAPLDPVTFWGRIDCVDDSRHQRIQTGGDQHPTAEGAPQGDNAFRRLSVLDGDEQAEGVGRCELGYNWSEKSDPGTGVTGPGPTVFYREGDRFITYASLRLPADGNVDDPDWRVLLQMKQAQPYNNLQGGSMFELQLRDGQWLVISDFQDVWTAPAQAGRWTRFAFDVTYSADPDKGSIQVHVDLNGDGDAEDEGERSPRFQLATLRLETRGREDAVPAGTAIPSHLRAGIYQNRNYRCPSPVGCHVDVDNVQVAKVP